MPSTCPSVNLQVTTIATITLPVQTVPTTIPTEEGTIVPLIPTEDPTVQILSLDANIMEEAAEVLDPSTLNVTEDILETALDTSKNISFEHDDTSNAEPTMFPRDEEFEEPDTLTAAQLEAAKKLDDNMETKDPIHNSLTWPLQLQNSRDSNINQNLW